MLALAVQFCWLHAQDLPSDVSSCSNASDGISLLQLGVHSLHASSDDDSKALPPTAQLFAEDVQENEEDRLAVKQLEDVDLGVLGNSLMVIDREATATGLGNWQSFVSMDRKDDPEWRVDIPKKYQLGNLRPLTWVFGSYHKTGCELSLGMCQALAGKRPIETAIRIQNMTNDNRPETDAFNHGAWGNWYFEPNVSIIMKLPDFRFVHMIRGPADLIVSSFHWHLQDSHDEYWLQDSMNKFFCMTRENCVHHYSIFGMIPQLLYNPSTFNKLVQAEHRDLLRHFNDSVNNGDTLTSFYKSNPWESGIVIEAYREMWTLNFMADNYKRTRQDDRAVQVHMEHTKSDFPGTMKCVFSFLQRSHDFHVDWAMNQIDKLDITKYGGQAATSVDGSKANHVNSMSSDQVEYLRKQLDGIKFVTDKTAEMQKPAVNDC